ncbi:NfeD family protein [Marinobacterium jannaschii]|uniref:NfeD family protein n=1 Tax=Marinobacterium jannaschii TaxID=64970 RepID=UPI000687BEBC|nr:nodulation protein NfeD [Marinobacterium jannaschii]
MLASLRQLLLTLFLLCSAMTTPAEEPAAPAAVPQGQIWQVGINGVIGPATYDLLSRTLEDARDASVSLLLITMDTPGGLDKAMRGMIQDIIASPVPVATYVSPSGARAASAGTYLLYASHIAAMAPATNLGAATPVQIGMPAQPKPPSSKEQDQPPDSAGAMQKKIINDASAYIRGLANLHGRNADWAEKAVREAASLDAAKALELKVIDLIARDRDHLLQQLEGRQIKLLGEAYTLHTRGFAVQEITADWRHEFLLIITNPNVAYILMLLGVYGLLMEFYNPGVGLPGIIGGISLITALYAFQLLPVSYAGMALIILGIALMVAEALSPSFGVFGFGGVIAFIFGSVLLMDTELPSFQIALPLIAAFSVFSIAVCIFALAMALKARNSKLVSGSTMLVGQQAQALCNFGCGSDTDESGKVSLNGEIWNARSYDPVHTGDRVKVTAIKGLWLEVIRNGHDHNGDSL